MCNSNIEIDGVAYSVPVEVASLLESVSIERDNLRDALNIIVLNARMIPDPSMDGNTDCYGIPLLDIEVTAHEALSYGK